MLRLTDEERVTLRSRLEKNLEGPVPCKTFMGQPTAQNQFAGLREKYPAVNGIYMFCRRADHRSLYVGSADEQDIVDRFQQHLQRGSGGTFRQNVEQDRNLTIDQALKYIRDRTELWIAITPAEEAGVWEHLAIMFYEPLHNRQAMVGKHQD